MNIIGISGQTGAGKSTFAKLLNQKLKGEYIDVDSLGHILLKDESTIQKLVKTFGKDILTESQINRKKLGAKAFVSSEATESLNNIMHPAMVEMVKDIIDKCRKQNQQNVIIDAALLYKMKLNKLCNKIIYVKADSEVRVKRLISSRGWTEQQARERLFSQDIEPNDENVIIIKNDGSLEELENIEVKM
jgi:dephospho-CoA kinase